MPFFEYPDEPILRTFEGKKEIPVALDADEPRYGKFEGSNSEAIAAAFRQENTIGSFFSSEMLGVDRNRVEPGYDVFEDIEGYEDYVESFEDIYNPEAASAMKRQIDREIKDRQILAASGWKGFAYQMGAAGLDWPTLIPSGAAVRGGLLGVKAGKMAAQVGLASGAAAGVAEVGLQGTQETRTATESAMAIGGSVILGGLLGYAGGRLITRSDFNQLSKIIDAKSFGVDINEPVADVVMQHLADGGSAVTIKPKLADMGISGAAAEKVAKLTSTLRLNPGVQTMVSPSSVTRRVFNELVENPVMIKMNEAGETIGHAVETLLKKHTRGNLSEAERQSRKIYLEMRKSGVKMTRPEFKNAVTRAGRRGDVGENEFISKAATAWRKSLFDKLKDEAIEFGIWPKDINPTTAISYITRLYNYDRLVAREHDFKRLVREWALDEIHKLPDAKKEGYVSRADMEAHAEEVADSVFLNVTGRGGGAVPDHIVPLERGPLKNRTLKISDTAKTKDGNVALEDFLENDIELVGKYYARTAGAEILLAKQFGRADMRDQFDELAKEYTKLRKEAGENPKKLKKLMAAEERDKANLEAFRDMLRGTYMRGRDMSAWGRVSRFALGLNFMRLLGGVTVSSIPDISRVIAFRGVTPLFSELLPALATNVRGLKMSVREAKLAGPVTETIQNTRLATLAELSDPMRARGSVFEQYMGGATQGFARLTGITIWNDFMKGTISTLAQNRILGNIKNWNNLSKRELTWMGHVGIDEVTAKKIAKQMDLHGEKSNTIWVANTEKWGSERAPVKEFDDAPNYEAAQAVRAFHAAIAKTADMQIVTKGVSDVPLWMHSNTGRLIMQFKSFAMASHQRVLLSGLQQGPRHIAQLVVTGTIMGMLVSYLKMIERGDIDGANALLENPGRAVAEGLDRSGILSWIMDVSSMAEKFNVPGVISTASRFAGDEDQRGPGSRYATRSKTGALAGPVSGFIEDFSKGMEQLVTGDYTKGGVNSMSRLLPGRSLPGVRSLLEYQVKPWAEDELVDE
jgi:hypothetical protein